MAGRFPEGMTGIEALKTLEIREPEWAENMGEGHAGDHYLRCGNGESIELSREDWAKFKKAGGTTYSHYAYVQSKSKAERIVESMVREEFIYPLLADKVVHTLLMEYGY